MAAIDRPGTFKARVVDYGMSNSKTGTPQFEIEFAITSFYNNGDWEDWTDYGIQTRGWFYPFTKQGKLNDTTVDQLMDSLGWDGLSISSLEKGDFAGMTVQINIKEDNYNGNTKLKVSWMNPEDYKPGIPKLENAKVGQLSSQFDQMLRARNGKKGASPAAPSTKKPPSQKKPKPVAAGVSTEEADKNIPF